MTEQTLNDNIVGVGFRLSAKPDYKLLGKTMVMDPQAWKIFRKTRYAGSIGDKIDTDNETLTVHSEPVKDIHKLIWSCDLRS